MRRRDDGAESAGKSVSVKGTLRNIRDFCGGIFPEEGEWRYFLVPAFIFIADQVSKYLVRGSFEIFENKPVIPGCLDLTLTYNAGAVFGALSDGALWWRRPFFVGISLVSVVILVVLWKMRVTGVRSYEWGILLILGGAAGNLADRICDPLGRVTDFIDFYYGTWHWFTFNLADAAVSVGLILLIPGMFIQGSMMCEAESTCDADE